jgi:alpha-mannosidase
MKMKLFGPISLIVIILTINTLNGQTSGKKQINDTTYMLTYDHGGLILWGSDHFMERLRNAIEWLDRYKSFKIGLDNEAYIYDYFGEYEPEIIDEIKGYLKKYQGRFGIGSSTYGQPLSQFVNDESNIRQIAYALEAEKKYFNYRPPVYMMSEHAMHSQIPQILNGFGYDGAIMRTHFMMYGYNPTFDVPIGWWKGIDGSRIATIPTYNGEGAEFFKTTVDTWILTRYPSKESPDNMESFRKKFRHINPLLASRADDSGLRKEELVKEYDKKPKFSWILLDDLLNKYPAPEVDMVTMPNDFTVRMPWGYCGNEIWNSSRKAENYVLVAERLAALNLLNNGESHEKELDEAWKNLLLAQHHDIQICGLLPDARRLLPLSVSKSEQVIKESMQSFAENMSGGGVKQITLFNPLSWSQTKWIITTLDISGSKPKNYVAECGGNELPVYIISPNASTDGKNIEVKAVFRVEIDPLSIASYSIKGVERINERTNSPFKTDEKNLTVLTPHYEIVLSENGGISSLKDAKTGKLLTSVRERAAFFEGKIDGVDCKSSGKWIIRRSSTGTPWITMCEHGFISDIPYVFEMTLYEDNPRIDCKVKFDFNGEKIGLLSDNKRDGNSAFIHEEKLRFKIYPNIDTAATGIRDLPFAVSETNNKYVEGNYWTALSDGSSGIAFFNKGNMGSTREKDHGYSIPLAYSMYYIWGTRMLYGPFEYEFAILPFRGDWKTADLHRKSLEYNLQMPVYESVPGTSKPGNIFTHLNISGDKDVLLTALYPENGKVIARFFKSDEISPVSSLTLNIKGRNITETRMDGMKIKEVVGAVTFKPWEVKTFHIDRE